VVCLKAPERSDLERASDSLHRYFLEIATTDQSETKEKMTQLPAREYL